MISQLPALRKLTLEAPIAQSDIVALQQCPKLRSFHYNEQVVFRYIKSQEGGLLHHVPNDQDLKTLALNQALEEIKIQSGEYNETTLKGVLDLLEMCKQLYRVACVSSAIIRKSPEFKNLTKSELVAIEI